MEKNNHQSEFNQKSVFKIETCFNSQFNNISHMNQINTARNSITNKSNYNNNINVINLFETPNNIYQNYEQKAQKEENSNKVEKAVRYYIIFIFS